MKKIIYYFLLVTVIISVNTTSVRANWFTDIIDAITSIWQPVWGKYDEGGCNRNPPLTTFDRKSDAYWSQRVKIRTNITNAISSGNDYLFYRRIYTKIYDNALAGDATSNSIYSTGASLCAAATLAKDAAFVFLIGMDVDGNYLTESTTPKRSDFYNKAVLILSKCDAKAASGSFSGKDNQMNRAYELIAYLQAHDYLRTTSGNEGYTYDNTDYENSRSQLADFTYDLYGDANNLGAALDLYNNQSLIVAGAVGMAAVSLSDKETYWWRFQKKPSRWANAAHAYINRTLWSGPGLYGEITSAAPGPMSTKSYVAGYAEGPHYFSISFESLLPFFNSFNNFLNEQDATGDYYTSMINFTPESVRNYG